MNSSTPALLEASARTYRQAIKKFESDYGTPHWTEHHELSTIFHYSSPNDEDSEIIVEIEADFTTPAVCIIAVLSSLGEDCVPIGIQRIPLN